MSNDRKIVIIAVLAFLIGLALYMVGL